MSIIDDPTKLGVYLWQTREIQIFMNDRQIDNTWAQVIIHEICHAVDFFIEPMPRDSYRDCWRRMCWAEIVAIDATYDITKYLGIYDAGNIANAENYRNRVKNRIQNLDFDGDTQYVAASRRIIEVVEFMKNHLDY